MDAGTVQTIFTFLHSWWRWILLGIMVATIIYFALGLAQRKAWDSLAARMIVWFGMGLRIQWLLGIILFIIRQLPAGFSIRHQWEHLVIQTVALGVWEAFSSRLLKSSAADNVRWRNGLVLALVVIAIVIVGIMRLLPDSIRWRFFLPG